MPFSMPYTLKPVRILPAAKRGPEPPGSPIRVDCRTAALQSGALPPRTPEKGCGGPVPLHDSAPGGSATSANGKEDTSPSASENSTTTDGGGGGGQDSKDVEKERHYNAFMEGRLKQGQTRTVAEPMMRLKAAAQQQQQQVPPRRGSAPLFSQAMLRRPSERRLSATPRSKVESTSKIDKACDADVKKEATPPGVASGRSRSSPVKLSPRSSPAKTGPVGSATMTSTTVVTTLTDLGRRDGPRGTAAAAPPVTTLRITKKPSAKRLTGPASPPVVPDATKTAGEASESPSRPDASGEERAATETRRSTPPKRTSEGAKSSAETRRTSPPKKTWAVSVPPRKRSQPLRIRATVTVEEGAPPKPAEAPEVAIAKKADGGSKQPEADVKSPPKEEAQPARSAEPDGGSDRAVQVPAPQRTDRPRNEMRLDKEKADVQKAEMQTVDIKDLRVLLRTPSPHPPKTGGRTADTASRQSSLSSLGKSSLDVPDDEASSSGVSSLSSVRRDSGSSRPSSLSWDSDVALSTATSTPSDAASALRSRSVSVESAVDLEDGPRAWAASVNSRLAPLGSPRRSAGRASLRAWSTSPAKPWWSATAGSCAAAQVGDLWADLGQEQAASAQAAEMLEAETAERLRLDKEVRELQARCCQLQQQKDRLEMEAMESRMLRSADLNGHLSDEDDGVGGSSVYKQKYERAVREAEMTRRKASQQHEEELEKQLLARKATEKRLTEALDSLEEGRQAVGQWKRKAQKLAAELQDLKLLVEEHMARNAELERKQRRFDGELSTASEGMRQERAQREKVQREKEALYAEKLSLEQELSAVRSELDSQHDKLGSLRREMDELSFSSHGEEEVAKLKRGKQELERKSREQEEELEDLAGQVQLLEQAKLRLEMALEKQRQEYKREISLREEEMDEARAAASKKLRNLESLLESEQEERQALSRQRQELERRLGELSALPPPRDPQVERRLRRDLRRTRALLQDAQQRLEGTRDGQAARALLRQLKNQLEDAEFAKTAAMKARQGAEMELQEVQCQLEEVLRTKNESEGRCIQLTREKSALQMQLEEMEEEQAELLKKYRSAVQQMASDQKAMAEQNQQILDLESEKHHLREQVHDLSSKMDHLSSQAEDSHAVRRLEAKVRDLESRLELEQTSKARLESQVARLKEQSGRLQEECEQAAQREHASQEGCRKLQRQLRELREDCASLQQREAEAHQRCHELELSLENAETDLQGTKQDLKLACQRIQDLQAALEEDLDSGTDLADDDSESDSDQDMDVDSLLRRHGLGPHKMAAGDCSPVLSRRSSGSVGLSLSRSNESTPSGPVSPDATEQRGNGRTLYKDDQLVDV
ncbi:unnamed protein product [Ixodes persulcatus]